MTELETSMASLMKIFDTYAAGEGKKDTLTKNETKTFLQKELPALLKATENQGEVDRLLNGLDFDGDSEVDFNEFVALVAMLCCASKGRICKK